MREIRGAKEYRNFPAGKDPDRGRLAPDRNGALRIGGAGMAPKDTGSRNNAGEKQMRKGGGVSSGAGAPMVVKPDLWHELIFPVAILGPAGLYDADQR